MQCNPFDWLIDRSSGWHIGGPDNIKKVMYSEQDAWLRGSGRHHGTSGSPTREAWVRSPMSGDFAACLDAAIFGTTSVQMEVTLAG